jgi:hypothetical protein
MRGATGSARDGSQRRCDGDGDGCAVSSGGTTGMRGTVVDECADGAFGSGRADAAPYLS